MQHVVDRVDPRCVEARSAFIRATLTLMSGILLLIGIVFAALAALLHVYIFVMESITWSSPATWKRFGLASQADADTTKPMALNQGFYNLFLAIGTIVGLLLLISVPAVGITLVLFAVASMLAASLVLVISSPKLARAAVTQGAFPLLAIIAFVVALLAE
jgi:putative membrane protein